MNNKKGFTLIELLAVIVILAIVTVIGATTILPYIQNASKDAFADEGNYVIEAAANAMSLISINSITKPTSNSVDYKYTAASGSNPAKYCFSLKQLVTWGLWSKDTTKVAPASGTAEYQGYVEVTVNGNAYSYKVVMNNSKYNILSNSGDVTTSEISETISTTSNYYNCSHT